MGLNPASPIQTRCSAIWTGQVYLQGINMGTSGATTKDAVANIRTVLDAHPAVAIVEFGGNDGLARSSSGTDAEESGCRPDGPEQCSHQGTARRHHAAAQLRPGLHQAFDKVYRELAAKHHAAFVPMIYKDLVNVPGTIQGDGIHPTAKGSEIIAKTLLPALSRLLQKSASGRI